MHAVVHLPCMVNCVSLSHWLSNAWHSSLHSALQDSNGRPFTTAHGAISCTLGRALSATPSSTQAQAHRHTATQPHCHTADNQLPHCRKATHTHTHTHTYTHTHLSRRAVSTRAVILSKALAPAFAAFLSCTHHNDEPRTIAPTWHDMSTLVPALATQTTPLRPRQQPDEPTLRRGQDT